MTDTLDWLSGPGNLSVFFSSSYSIISTLEARSWLGFAGLLVCACDAADATEQNQFVVLGKRRDCG